MKDAPKDKKKSALKAISEKDSERDNSSKAKDCNKAPTKDHSVKVDSDTGRKDSTGSKPDKIEVPRTDLQFEDQKNEPGLEVPSAQVDISKGKDSSATTPATARDD